MYSVSSRLFKVNIIIDLTFSNSLGLIKGKDIYATIIVSFSRFRNSPILQPRVQPFVILGKHFSSRNDYFYGFYYLRERSCNASSSYRGSRKMTPSPALPADPVGTCGVDNPHICNRRRSRPARCPAGSRRHCGRLLETEKSPVRLTSGPEIPGHDQRYVRRRTTPLKRSTSKDISVPECWIPGDSSPNA